MLGQRISKKRSADSQSWRKSLSRTMAFCAAVVALWVTAGFFLYVAPHTDVPEHADVLFVLAPQGDRMEFAEQLMDQGVAGTLAVSAPQGTDDSAALCKQNRAYRVVCFDPDPVTTQGEARALKRLSEEYGWKGAVVLTAQFHVSRARVLMQRCYHGDLGMIAFGREMPLVGFPHEGRSSWAYHFVYESAAFIKVAINQDC
jgi:uncharacterized SAM-binding protein YcdF (DUF218 family)